MELAASCSWVTADIPLPLGPMIAAIDAGWNNALTSCSRHSFSLRLARLRTCAHGVMFELYQDDVIRRATPFCNM